MKRYYKIINTSKVRGGTNVSICGVRANYDEWAKHCFLPKEGVVGILVGEGESCEGDLFFLECATNIYVPILPSGVKPISEYEYYANSPLNLMVGKATHSEIEQVKGNDFVNSFMSQFGFNDEDEDDVAISLSEQENTTIILNLQIDGTRKAIKFSVPADGIGNIDSSLYRTTLQEKLPLFYNMFVPKEEVSFVSICKSIAIHFNELNIRSNNAYIEIDKALIEAVKERISINGGYIDFYELIAYVDAFSYIFHAIGKKNGATIASVTSMYAFKLYDFSNTLIKYVLLDSEYLANKMTYNRLRSIAMPW